MLKKIVVNITTADIARSRYLIKRNDTDITVCCPVALALKRALGARYSVSVAESWVILKKFPGPWNSRHWFNWHTASGQKVAEFIEDYDKGHRVRPFTVTGMLHGKVGV